MKRVTKNNLIRLVRMKKQYEKTGDEELKRKINEYVENVINKDKRYYSKLSKYKLDYEMIKYLIM